MLLLYNAKIFTMDDKHSEVTAILIQPNPGHNGRIQAIGTLDEVRKFAPSNNTEEIDMQGRCILPGLTDAHIHFRRYALSLNLVDVDTPSLTEAIDRIRKKVKVLEPGEWLLGHGWRQNNWAEGFGSKADLDAVAPNNPVYLTAASLHAAWVNSSALKIAGISDNQTDPPKGQIMRDAKGETTGIVLESAMSLVSSAIPESDEEQSLVAMEQAQSKLWKMGITAIHDFDRLESFKALQILHSKEKLKLRVHKNLPVESLQEITELSLRSGFGDDLLWIGGIKDFADGALGPQTAAMLEPYEGSDSNRGILLADAEEITEWGQKAVSHGLTMTVHAIGDRANHEVINAYERIREFEKLKGLKMGRHRIEHVQIIHPSDLKRLAELKLNASVQAIHQPSDRDSADNLWGSRSKHAYAWKSILDSGARLAFGSDAPVESPNPFWGIHAAVTRKSHRDKARERWFANQQISMMDALRGYTLGPAYMAGKEGSLGKISPGYLADLIVIEQNIFEVDENNLDEISPQATMVGGEWVWKSDESSF
jgi:hypothetical protein